MMDSKALEFRNVTLAADGEDGSSLYVREPVLLEVRGWSTPMCSSAANVHAFALLSPKGVDQTSRPWKVLRKPFLKAITLVFGSVSFDSIVLLFGDELIELSFRESPAKCL